MNYLSGTIAKMLKDYPDKTHSGFFFVSGYGLVKDGKTCLVLNQFNDGYYKLARVEAEIFHLAGDYKNAYLVGIFATERETFNKEKHSGMISYELAEAKRKEWQEIWDSEQKSKQNSDGKEQTEEQKAQPAEKLEQEQKPDEGERQQEKTGGSGEHNVAKTRGGGEEDKTRKYTFIFGAKVGFHGLLNDRLIYQFVQCLLTNFDPVTMTATLPDLFSNIKVNYPV